MIHQEKSRVNERGGTMTAPLWLVDAFTGISCLGNPAGVCLVSDFPDESVMQQIAFELHWSETAFLKRLADNSFHIRWFAPEDEAPMCGHATLAAAHLLFEQNKVNGDTVLFQSKAGALSVHRDIKTGTNTDDEQLWLIMDFPACPLTQCDDDDLLCAFQDILGAVRIQGLYRDSLIFVALLESEEAVRRCCPQLSLLAEKDCRALSVTAKASTPGFDFVSRYFAPRVGIPEDPVCGSSHCRLAPFWAHALGKTSLKALQASRRGGVLHVTYDKSNNKSPGRVFIAGQARTMMRGEILV